jgi:hypothetical protein
MKSPGAHCVVLLLALLGWPASDIVAEPVTNTNDSGDGSLRQAILDANVAGGDEITFSNVTGTITLLSPLPALAANITITGPGRDVLTVSGGNSLTSGATYPTVIGSNNFSLFTIYAGTTNTLSGLTIANGMVSNDWNSPSMSGGGISNAGCLTLLDCSILNCEADYSGGGVYNEGVLFMKHCEVADCLVHRYTGGGPGGGGGIANMGDMRLEDCRVSQCGTGVYSADGGGIYNEGTLLLTNCVIESCLCDDDYNGAGICSSGSLSMHSCTVSNCLGGWGGGVCCGDLAMTNSAIVANAGAFGGGLFIVGGTNVILVNCTVSENARGYGICPWLGVATIYMNSCTVAFNTTGGVAGGTVYSQNSILADNNIGSGGDFDGVLTSQGYNLIQNTNGCTIEGDETGNLYGVDPVLGPLGDYGGPTPTIPLLTGSPAIDAGGTSGCPPTDQRGRTRPYGPACDIGAFESSPPYVIRGTLSGSTLNEPLTLLTSPGNPLTAQNGPYSVEGLSPNTYTLTPSNADFYFVPTNQLVTVGPDQVYVNFKGFRHNALSLEGVSNGVLHLIYAGTNGDTVRTLASSNLVDWTAIFTHTVPETNLFDIFDETSQPQRFYRTATR